MQRKVSENVLTKPEVLLVDFAVLPRNYKLGKDANCAGILLISF